MSLLKVRRKQIQENLEEVGLNNNTRLSGYEWKQDHTYKASRVQQ